ncbi:unnamed protein product, partial [Mesorhabditis belari]|uniref:Uncharacterized protein n=1 Tax=Mesorhabditis belari TaxID=2138241 RepID=A0AAF3FT27_9BILA
MSRQASIEFPFDDQNEMQKLYPIDFGPEDQLPKMTTERRSKIVYIVVLFILFLLIASLLAIYLVRLID